MQMLHSAYDLQEALSWTEFVWIIEVSVPLLEEDLENLAEDTLDIENPFGLKLMCIRDFREFDQVKALGLMLLTRTLVKRRSP